MTFNNIQLNGEIDYAKGGAGRVGFGFTFEQQESFYAVQHILNKIYSNILKKI